MDLSAASKPETLPMKDSVLKRDPLPVSEVQPKKVVLAKGNSTEKAEGEIAAENQQKQTPQPSPMEIDLTEDTVISPSNQT